MGDMLELTDEVLISFKEEYKDLCENWKTIENKAQGTAALSGVFLAAIFSWSRAADIYVNPSEKLLLIICLFLLITSIILCVLSLYIKEYTYPPFGKISSDMLGDLEKHELTSSIKLNFKNDLIERWKKTNNELRSLNNSKANKVFYAQILLLFSITLTALSCLLSIVQ